MKKYISYIQIYVYSFVYRTRNRLGSATVSESATQVIKDGRVTWPHRGGSQHREPKTIFSPKSQKVIWSRNVCFSYGFAPYFA